MSNIKIKFLKDVKCKISIFDWSQTPPDYESKKSFKTGEVITVSEKNLFTNRIYVCKYWLDSDLTNHDDAFVDILLKKDCFEKL